MDKTQLVDILHHYGTSTEQEAEEVISLRNMYPYSQVLQALAARVSKDYKFSNQQQLLQSAAVYSTDRTVLKEIMERIITKPSIAKESPVEIEQEVKVEVQSKPTIKETIDSSIDYADELLVDLKRLNELKVNYENLVADIGEQPAEIQKPAKRPPGRPKKKVEPHADPLIEEIKTSKKKIDPESPKTKEQIAIIDQFIKAQPTIASKAKLEDTPASDFAADLKSGEYADTIVSETLAEILVKQGKKEKAIEVFRKLIWKFPQKKAYFAAQIEELKK